MTVTRAVNNDSRHWTYIPELDRYAVHEWYNYDEFKHLGYREWEWIFPRGKNVKSTGPKWVYESGYNGDKLRAEGLETATNLLHHNVVMSEPWTSFLGNTPGTPTSVYFVFMREEDVVKFLLFNTITSLKKFAELP